MEKETRGSRIDVQIKLKKMIDMMERIQGASVQEICAELECNPKTFYRNLEKLRQMDVPFFTKPNMMGETNSVRYHIEKTSIKGSDVFLSAAEKALIRMMIQSTDSLFALHSENAHYSQTLLNKLNDGIIHDTRDSEYKFLTEDFSLKPRWEYDKTFYDISNALDIKQSITFSTIEPEKNRFEKEFAAIEDKVFFQTYAIINFNGTFYALGKIEPFSLIPADKNIPAEIRCVKIQNIKNIKFYKQYIYSIPSDFDFYKWYNFYFPKPLDFQNYQIEVNEEALHTILHASQYYPEAVLESDGKKTLIFKTQKRAEFLKYIRTLGAGVKVISPEDFALEVQEDLRKTLSLYKKD